MLHRDEWFRRMTEARSEIGGIGRDFELRLGALREEDIRVGGFFGTEALNELYAFDVVFSVPAVEGAALLGMLGHDACLRLHYPGGSRVVLGIAATLEILEPREDAVVAHVEIVPRLWTLGRTRASRVYQNMTTQAIVAEVLDRHGVPHRFALDERYAEHEHCVQYDESDLAFVLRLLAEEGFTFTFEHLDEAEARAAGLARSAERLVIDDDATLYTPLPKVPPAMLYKPDATQASWAAEPIVRLVHRSAIAPNRVTLRDYDFERAAPVSAAPNPSPPVPTLAPAVQNGAFTMVARADTAAVAADLEVYDHRADERAARGDRRRAPVRLEQLRGASDVFHGASWSRRFSPGRRFVVLDYTPAAGPTELALTRVTHASHPAKGGDRAEYANEFEAVRGHVLLRPAVPPRRFVQTVETATVVGAPGQIVDTDLHGRIKVQFHWDRHGTNDDRSSCWIRVTQPWSGPSFGFQFVPRIGSEVLVAFIGGDPDHPVVIGSLPNTANRLPHLLPQDSARSAIRSFSMPETGGFNEILFVDRAGEELLSLRAERNHEVVALGNHRLDVGGEATVAVGARRVTTVGGDDDGDVGGNAHRRVGGNTSDLVAGSRTDTVGGTMSTTVAGGSILTVGGVAEQTIGGSFRTVVGPREPADALTSVNGEYRVAASDFMDLRSEKRIRLSVGDTSIELTPEGLTIEANKIDVAVKDALSTKSGSVEMLAKGPFATQGATVTAVSAGATLSLTAAAALDGAAVLLNCNGQIPKPIVDGPPRQKGKVTFRVDPPPDLTGPFTLVVQTPTGKTVELETDAENKVELEGEEDDEFTLVEVRKGPVVLQQHGGGTGR